MNVDDLKQSIYEHGGSRIYQERGRERNLLVDTYGDEELALATFEFVKSHLSNHVTQDKEAG